MNNLRGLQTIRKVYKLPKALIRELRGVTKGVDEMIDEGVVRFFGHVERMENDRIPKRDYVREWGSSHSVGPPRKT